MDQNKFGYQPNIGNMEEYLKANEQSSNYTGPNWWTIPHGTSCIRVLPPWDPTGRVALTVYQHPIEFQGKGMRYKKYNWTCINKTFGKKCNICEGLNSIKEAGVDISNYEPNRRVFYLNALVLMDPDYEKDIRSGKKPEDCYGAAPGSHVLMRAPKTVYDWIISNITNPMVGDITSVNNGIDILITKEGQGLGTEYRTTLSPNGRQPINQTFLEKIENLYNLDEIFSTGFEDDQVSELVDTLRRSSQTIQYGVNNTSTQMSGYQPQGQYNQFQQQQPMNNQFQQQQPMNNQFNIPQATPFQNQPAPQTPPWEQQVNQTNQQPPVQQQNNFNQQSQVQHNASDVPSCFSKEYSPSDVKCVTCSHEIPCSKASGK